VTGICGQAPSDYPEFARFLVECGINSISLNADTVIKTTLDILKLEKSLKKGKAEAAAKTKAKAKKPVKAKTKAKPKAKPASKKKGRK
jgi:phosphoenolpyruvate-protein kinase (PTS system EI component)